MTVTCKLAPQSLPQRKLILSSSFVNIMKGHRLLMEFAKVIKEEKILQEFFT